MSRVAAATHVLPKRKETTVRRLNPEGLPEPVRRARDLGSRLRPASMLVEVSKLGGPGLRIESEAIFASTP
jgi:hypothetical protein